MAGGLLRAATSFAPTFVTSPAGRAALYLAVDILLGLALTSFYRTASVSFPGAVGLTLALAGLIIVRLSQALSSSVLYAAAALTTAVGVLVLGATLWQRRIVQAWVPGALIVSIVLGSVGTAVGGAAVALVLSGVAFGLAFAAIGRAMWLAEEQFDEPSDSQRMGSRS